MAVMTLMVGCHGYVDPATLPKEPENPTDEPTPGDKVELELVASTTTIKADGNSTVTFSVFSNEEKEDDAPTTDEQLAEGTMRIYANKTTLKADGTDCIDFTILYGTEDGNLNISEGPTTRLVYRFNGEETKLGYGVHSFSTTTPGSYTIYATAYRSGDRVSENEITITAENSNTTGLNFYHKQLGMQFTSIGCQNCPALSEAIKAVQRDMPGRLVAVSFHEDFKVQDPMTLPISTKYHSHLGEDGLPRFFLNMRVGDIGAFQSSITKGIENHISNYPPTCGVAIESKVEGSTLKLKSKITSATATAYRYEVFLVEDGIVYEQLGATGSYTHNNVVRHVLSGGITGARFNLGNALEAGREYSEERDITLDSKWNVENMRIVVMALTTPDGGSSYVVNNCNECKMGESADYEYADNSAIATLSATRAEGVDVTSEAVIRCTTTGQTLTGNSFTTTEAGTYEFVATYKNQTSNKLKVVAEADDEPTVTPPATGDIKSFVRHIAIMEFTGTWCSFCPDGYSLLQMVLKNFGYEERAHILALHDGTSGEDPMALKLTTEINQVFGTVSYPGFLIDLREAGEITGNSSGIRSALKRSDDDYPAHSGIALETTYNETTMRGTVKAKVYAATDDRYRIAVYILENGIIHPQKSGSIIIENYAHDHVVRQLLSASYKGDLVGDLKAGEETTKEYKFELTTDNVAANCTALAMVIDSTGYVNNVMVCPLVNGKADYDIAE